VGGEMTQALYAHMNKKKVAACTVAASGQGGYRMVGLAIF
jgi:hypothetical protein